MDQASTTIASLRETDEGIKSDISDLMMARAELSAKMDLCFARTAERFARVDKKIPRIAEEELCRTPQEYRKSKRRNAHDKPQKADLQGQYRQGELRHEDTEPKESFDDSK